MDFEEVHNNLRAIRLLYRLLDDNGLTLQNANSEDTSQLVERARFLLKSLLDTTVESVFETHLKIMGAQAGISKTSFEEEKHLAVLQSKYPIATIMSESSVKYPTSSKITSQKDDQAQLKLGSKEELPELSKFSISNDEGSNDKVLCSLGEEISMMQQNLVKATHVSTENSILPNTDGSHQEQQHNNVNTSYGVGEHAKESLQKNHFNEDNIQLPNRTHEAQCKSNAAKQLESLYQSGDFSNDLVNAIKRIESRILASQLCSSLVDSTNNSAGDRTMHKVANSDIAATQRNDRASGTQLSSGNSLFEGNRLMNQQTGKPSFKGENLISSNSYEKPFFSGNESLNLSQKAYQLHANSESAKNIDIPKQIGSRVASGGEKLRDWNTIQPPTQNVAVVDRLKSLNRLVSGDAHLRSQASECIQGLRVPLNLGDVTEKSPMLAGQTNRKSLVRKNPKAAGSRTNQHQNSVVSYSRMNPNASNFHNFRTANSQKPPLLPKAGSRINQHQNSEFSYTQKLVGSKPTITKRGNPPPHQMVIRPTLLDQKSSEIEVNSHQHRDWSVLDKRGTHKTGHLEPQKTRIQPQRHEFEDSSSNSDSSRWSSQREELEFEDGSLPVETQGPTSGSMLDEAYEGSSEESDNSSGMLSDVGPRERNPKKTIGGLRRVKNKLGLIFHHHHHHHHHHHDDDKVSNKHSMWNHLQNAFHHKNKHGVLTKPKVEKTRRGTIARVLPRRNQVGQFHRLVEGLVRHIRRSKKPKPSKLDGAKRLRDSAHGHSQKKLHWWQILRRHRGVKLKNKGRVKMGFKSPKSLKN